MIEYVLISTFLIAFILSIVVERSDIKIEKPEKRTYLFEDDDGNKENPFSTEIESNEWKYY